MSALIHRSTLLAVALSAGFWAAFSTADIKEIPADEMTEAYIKDTTVIVPKQQGSQDKTAVSVKIAPNPAKGDSGMPADPNNAANKRPDLEPLLDQNLAKHQEYSLQQQQSQVNVPNLDLLQKNRDDNLRKILTENNIDFTAVGVPTTGPIDYSQLKFSNLSVSSGGLSGSNNGSNQFVITVPTNQANTNGPQNLTPGGEYQVQINNNQLQFIINKPQP